MFAGFSLGGGNDSDAILLVMGGSGTPCRIIVSMSRRSRSLYHSLMEVSLMTTSSNPVLANTFEIQSKRALTFIYSDTIVAHLDLGLSSVFVAGAVNL